MALVCTNGQPFIIDKAGKIVLPQGYKAIKFVEEKLVSVKTTSNKWGLVDLNSNKLLIDTSYSSIEYYKPGIVIVKEYIDPTKEKKKPAVGAIDLFGNVIAPVGKYESIHPFVDGIAVVEIRDPNNKDATINGVIDAKGNLLFERSKVNSSWIDQDFHEGYARVNLYKYWLPEEKGVFYTTAKAYEGYINLKGELILNDTNYRRVSDFSNGRAFLANNDRKNIMVDRNFKQVGNKSFYRVPKEFKNNYAVVETNKGFGIIDSSANLLVDGYDAISEAGIIDDYFFFGKRYEDYRYVFGVADLKGKIIIKPIMNQFDRSGFIDGVISAVVNHKLTFINQKGKIVWQQAGNSTTKLDYMNIDYMNDGYFYAYANHVNTEHAYSGGWATSSYKSRDISSAGFPENSISITIDTTLTDTFAYHYYGFKLFISNTTGDTVKFNAEDNRLYLKLQALNEAGEWKDIEYLPKSFCGNSYHTIDLEPHAFWDFTIPNYQGELQTKIRAELTFIDRAHPENDKKIYSNTINGGINPAQFWNKLQYYPTGIMDPYID